MSNVAAVHKALLDVRDPSHPAALERAIVARSRVAGKKLRSHLAYGLSKAFVIKKDHGASDPLKSAAVRRFGEPVEIAASSLSP